MEAFFASTSSCILWSSGRQVSKLHKTDFVVGILHSPRHFHEKNIFLICSTLHISELPFALALITWFLNAASASSFAFFLSCFASYSRFYDINLSFERSSRGTREQLESCKKAKLAGFCIFTIQNV
jgi:hypothetical protein